MSNFFNRNGGNTGKLGNVPALTGGSFGSQLAGLTAKQVPAAAPAAATPTVASKPAGGATLAQLAAAKQAIETRLAKPFLVYLMLDLTASRRETRAAMIAYEREIAKLIMESGGRHPVLCKGVYFRGNSCSAPIPLNTAEDVMAFFNTTPIGGGTRIHDAVHYYANDPTDAILSFGIFIGDTADGDNPTDLVVLARSMNNDRRSRPLVIAHEQTSDADSRKFCGEIAPKVAEASGGFAWPLSENPNELMALLRGYQTILSTPPHILRAGGGAGNAPVAEFPNLSRAGVGLLTKQAGLLRLGGPK